MKYTDLVEELSAGAVLEEDELPVGVLPGAVALDDVVVLEQLVHADLLHDGLAGDLRGATGGEVDLLHGARLARGPVEQELHLGERPLAEDLADVPALNELVGHLSGEVLA